MAEKVPTPVSGDAATKGAPDGVSDAPGKKDGGNIHGRTAGGESGGGAYPNPQTGKTEKNGGFFGHGGQTEIGYHGSGQAGEQGSSAPNAATEAGSNTGDEDDSSRSTVPTAEHTPRSVSSDNAGITVVETSGVAAAEATGKIGTDEPHEQEQPGSG